MKKEEKQLLLKDLCARLPYGVKFVCNKNVYTAKWLDLIVTDEGDWEYAVTAKGIEPIEIDFVKPYLRPMSSMTEEEKEEYTSYCFEQPFLQKDKIPNLGSVPMCMDWLLSKHFDFRGLIEKGLALEAPKGMYK